MRQTGFVAHRARRAAGEQWLSNQGLGVAIDWVIAYHQ
jgi:hypothetical protein